MFERFPKIVVVGLVLAGSLLTAGATGALVSSPTRTTAVSPAAMPPAIASINLAHVSKHLAQAVVESKKLRTELRDFQAKLKLKETALNKLREPLNPQSTISFRPHTPEYRAQYQKVLKATVALRVFQEYNEARMRIRHRLTEAKLYRAINAAVARYARAHGIFMVVVTHTMHYNVPHEADLLAEIASRNIMYVKPSLDISDAIVRIMNKQYEKSRGH